MPLAWGKKSTLLGKPEKIGSFPSYDLNQGPRNTFNHDENILIDRICLLHKSEKFPLPGFEYFLTQIYIYLRNLA